MKVKKKAQVIKEYPEHKKIIKAVVNQLNGTESMYDIYSHGINGGYQGFVYYTDTCEFAKDYQKEILALLEEDADSLGEDIVDMITHFGIFRNSKADNDDRKEIYRFLANNIHEDDTQIPDLMAKYAGETVARWFCE